MTHTMVLYDVEIFGLHYPELEVGVDYHIVPRERGSRDSFGQPIEPDYPASVEIDNVYYLDTVLDEAYNSMTKQLSEYMLNHIEESIMEEINL